MTELLATIWKIINTLDGGQTAAAQADFLSVCSQKLINQYKERFF